MNLDFLDDRASLISLLVENDRLKSYSLQEAGDRFARAFVMAVYDENFAVEYLWCRNRLQRRSGRKFCKPLLECCYSLFD